LKLPLTPIPSITERLRAHLACQELNVYRREDGWVLHDGDLMHLATFEEVNRKARRTSRGSALYHMLASAGGSATHRHRHRAQQIAEGEYATFLGEEAFDAV